MHRHKSPNNPYGLDLLGLDQSPKCDVRKTLEKAVSDKSISQSHALPMSEWFFFVGKQH